MLVDPTSDHAILTLLIATAALGIDWLIGDPPWLWRRLPHPVALIGQLITRLEERLNRYDEPDAARRRRGALTVLIVVGIAALAGWAVGALARTGPAGWLLELLLVTTLIAQRDLFDHVRRVGLALDGAGLAGGRAAVSHIVGRDPESLDRHGVLRAAIESLAENFSDGVIAPLFWYLLLGPIGICAYKAINTLDSMIGHRSLRYAAFGMVAARLDDAVNLIPARLAGLVLAVAAAFVPTAHPVRALRTMLRDAAKHRSPNAGWPEAAMAGALDLALAGPRRYGSEVVQDPWIGAGRARVELLDLKRALALFMVAGVLPPVLMTAAVVLLLQP